jgi:SAM-dependent methyltransferase
MNSPFKRNTSLDHLWRVNKAFAAGVTPGMAVLDAGAGMAPYRGLFSHATYETADFQKVDKAYAEQTFVCDLAAIPAPDARYDRIVFNQVMEHLPDPARVLREFHRLLKPGGRILCTCPFYFEEHETPYDFFRYTQFGHRALFEGAGFEVESVEWLEGYYGTLAYQMQRLGKNLRLLDRQTLTSPAGLAALPYLALLKLTAFLGAAILPQLDLSIRLTQRGHPINYVTVARKPQ